MINIRDYLNKELKFKLIQNKFNLNLPIIIRSYIFNETNVSEQYYSYIWIDGKIEILKYGKQIKNYIKSCMSGFYGSEDAQFISETKCKYYVEDQDDFKYSDNKRDLIEEGYKKEDIKDVIYYDMFNPFDLVINKWISIGVSEVKPEGYENGFLKFKPIRIYDGEFLNIENKDEIIKKYDDFGDIIIHIENYEKEHNLTPATPEEINIAKRNYYKKIMQKNAEIF